MNYRFSTNGNQATIAFDAKPPAEIRGILKRNGFRWSPSGGYWWRSKIRGAADVATAIDRFLRKGQPDGTCWNCKERPGFFRNRGAAAPVLCDECCRQQDRDDVDALAAALVDVAHNGLQLAGKAVQ